MISLFFLSVPKPAGAACRADSLASYLAGVTVLQTIPDHNGTTRALWYRRLVDVTGIDARCAAGLLNRYYNRPAEWKKLQSAIIEQIEPPEPITTQKE